MTRPQKKQIPKLSKEPIAKIKRACKKLVDEIVSIRDKDVCQRCGERVYGSNRHRSHVVPVSAGNKLRFDPINIKILCFHCHMNFWHKHIREAASWFEEKFPERSKYLDAQKGIAKFYYQDWLDLKAKLEAELELMK